MVSWEEAREFLRHLLLTYRSSEPAGITISNLKRLFHLEFQRELSQTVLGHVRLLDLLRDPRLSDICSVRAHSNGQMLVRAVEDSHAQLCPSVPPGVWLQMVSIPVVTVIGAAETPAPVLIPEFIQETDKDSPRSSWGGSTIADARELETSDDDLVSTGTSHDTDEAIDDDTCSSAWAINVKNTFIDLPVHDPSFSPRSARQRRRSVPARM